jgi:hypothetical protein
MLETCLCIKVILVFGKIILYNFLFLIIIFHHINFAN